MSAHLSWISSIFLRSAIGQKSMEKRIDQLQKAMKTALVDPDDTKVNKALMDSIQNFVRVTNR